MQSIYDSIQDIFLASGDKLSEVEAAVRTVLIYIAAVVLVRLGKKRFMAGNTAFDVVISVMLGSILSRAGNGSASLGPTLAAGAALIAMHWVLSWLAFKSHLLGKWIKGNSQRIVEGGEIQWDAMKESHITEHDLKAALRLEVNRETLEDVAVATLERSGEISVIEKPKEPRVIEITVKDGVQTVRLEIA